ncbi:hypothetical protein PAERUG_P54_1_London_24_VIM_2_04_13_00073 [Pseudomonas aeruginosa]|nr:hypothetical protein PAERUG_E16_London_17_VIM_2_04_14_04638 [Pseudomonas aeruginosa]CRW87156.1 hypothetical protein PAERUG_P54_1_London_24_VIM_2_04_13_00073 [Pseudomonas aeruginosa]
MRAACATGWMSHDATEPPRFHRASCGPPNATLGAAPGHADRYGPERVPALGGLAPGPDALRYPPGGRPLRRSAAAIGHDLREAGPASQPAGRHSGARCARGSGQPAGQCGAVSSRAGGPGGRGGARPPMAAGLRTLRHARARRGLDRPDSSCSPAGRDGSGGEDPPPWRGRAGRDRHAHPAPHRPGHAGARALAASLGAGSHRGRGCGQLPLRDGFVARGSFRATFRRRLARLCRHRDPRRGGRPVHADRHGPAVQPRSSPARSAFAHRGGGRGQTRGQLRRPDLPRWLLPRRPPSRQRLRDGRWPHLPARLRHRGPGRRQHAAGAGGVRPGLRRAGCRMGGRCLARPGPARRRHRSGRVRACRACPGRRLRTEAAEGLVALRCSRAARGGGPDPGSPAAQGPPRAHAYPVVARRDGAPAGTRVFHHRSHLSPHDHGRLRRAQVCGIAASAI